MVENGDSCAHVCNSKTGFSFAPFKDINFRLSILLTFFKLSLSSSRIAISFISVPLIRSKSLASSRCIYPSRPEGPVNPLIIPAMLNDIPLTEPSWLVATRTTSCPIFNFKPLAKFSGIISSPCFIKEWASPEKSLIRPTRAGLALFSISGSTAVRRILVVCS
ncbi:hypothetical protein ES705_50302 [subsurface metagenome]